MEQLWKKRTTGLQPLSIEAMNAVEEELKQKLKPVGSLGKLEELAMRLAGIYGLPLPEIKEKAIVMMAADNGVYEEGVNTFPQEVTCLLAEAGDAGLIGVSVLARHAGARLLIVDVGLKGEVRGDGIIRKRVRPGTGNIAQGPAMTGEEMYRALLAGYEATEALVKEGVQVFGLGEVGLCNTTTSAAMLCAFTGQSPEDVVGAGTGGEASIYALKVKTVEKALRINKPDPEDPYDVLSKVGGLEIAAMVGSCFAAACHRKPMVIDGFIAGVAALTAVKINPMMKEYLFPSHLSAEKGAALVMESLGMEPMLLMKMRLGEGTGAALAFPLLDAALKIYREMGTFADLK
ncbi:MAG: nicotinate-nucleotide--dimethylbenzimidazole phosphoribosyltransferase [Peptococcia bacterium]|jgi:nicotinate-nucleotide--dimethylbenzimidazole phosphoribosyltransferase